jgi:hypothetical protein
VEDQRAEWRPRPGGTGTSLGPQYDPMLADNNGEQRSAIVTGHRPYPASSAGPLTTPVLSRTEEARASNPLTSTPNLAGQSVAGPHRRRSPRSGAALGPRSIAVQRDLRPAPVPDHRPGARQRPQPRLRSRHQGWHLVDHATGTTHRSPRDDGEPADYAYLGRLPRIDDRGTFLYLAGIHAPGNAGAVHYLEGHLEELYGEVRSGRFSTITSCRFDPDSRQVTSSERVTPLYRTDSRA